MNITKREYKNMAQKASPPSHLAKNCLWAFMVGGAICVLGEGLFNFYKNMGFIISDSRLLASVTLVGLSGILTATGLYGKLAKKAGAGTLIPITGFANAVVSPSMEFKAEGLISGVGARMFIIAGPVIVYGVLASTIYGIFLYLVMPMLR